MFRAMLLSIVLCASLVHASSLTPAASRFPIPTNFHRLSGPQDIVPCPVEIVDPGPSNVRIRFYDPPISFEPVSNSEGDFTAVRITGESSTAEDGAPDVPCVSRLLMIAPTGQARVGVLTSSFHVEQLPSAPAPYQTLGTDSETSLVILNEQIYSANNWYPRDIAVSSSPATLRDLRVVALNVYPVQVNPVTNEIRIYDEIEVVIEYVGGVGENEIHHVPHSVSPDFKKIYSTIPNFAGSPIDDLPVAHGHELIMYRQGAPGFETVVSQLVEWRKQKGIYAYAYAVPANELSPSGMRSRIQIEYTASQGELETVCMIGDPASAAGLLTHTADDGLSEYDNFFGALGVGPNPDPIPDVAVGRITSTTANELASVVTKSINYEFTPYVPTNPPNPWQSRAYCMAHTVYIFSNCSTKEYTRQIMLRGAVQEVELDCVGDPEFGQLISDAINGGVCVFNHRLSNVGQYYPSTFANGAMLPFVAMITCGTGDFHSAEAASEAWVNMGTVSSPSGAIGCVGVATTNTHVAENNIIDAGLMDAIFRLGIRSQGVALVYAKTQLYACYAGHRDENVNEFSWWSNLIGDPGVELMIGEPRALTVLHPSQIHSHTNDIQISVYETVNGVPVPVLGALVGLYDDSQSPPLLARAYTDGNGFVSIAVNTAAEGSIYVTVTGPQLLTYNGSIDITADGAALYLDESEVTIDDDMLGGTSGNDDGILNPGEVVDLNPRLRNTSATETVTSISGTLTSRNPGCTIVGGTSSYADIGPNGAQYANTPFRCTLCQIFDSDPIVLDLLTASSYGPQEMRIAIPGVAGDVSFVASTYLGDEMLDPGDIGAYSVEFLNSGHADVVGAIGTLRSLDEHIVITDSIATFGDVSEDQTASNTGDPFQLRTSVYTVGGYIVPMLLFIADENGFRDSVSFEQTVGERTLHTATGPDPYGYYAFDDSETQPIGTAAEFQWIEIAETENLLINTDVAEDLDQVVVRDLPFDFRFYGNTFDRISICSNGWVAFGEVTNIDARNYPIPGPLGPMNMVAVYWDDLVTIGTPPGNPGVYAHYDAEAHRYVVEWRTRIRCLSNEPQVFQLQLLDPLVWPSPTGDGKILTLYQSIDPDEGCGAGQNDNEWATVGIQNHDHSMGLQYCYWNGYSPGASELTPGRAIMYTTDNTGSATQILQVLYPAGGEVLFVDSLVTISWVPYDPDGFVDLSVSREGLAGDCVTIASGTPDDGSFEWIVEGPASVNCRVYVYVSDLSGQGDVSMSDFQIGYAQYSIWDDFETGALGWTHGTASPWYDQWHVSSRRTRSGSHAFKCGDTGLGGYNDSLDARLTSPVVNVLPARSTLRFYHQIGAEVSLQTDSAYDGGVIEVSMDGGAFQQVFPTPGYNNWFRYTTGSSGPYTGPMPGLACYSGTDTALWKAEEVDLSAFAGHGIRVRFRFGSDSEEAREGWYIDDVTVASAFDGAPPDPVDPQHLTIGRTGSQLYLRWADDDNLGYRVYSGPSEGGPWTLVATTFSNVIMLPSGFSANREFFLVVGFVGD